MVRPASSFCRAADVGAQVVQGVQRGRGGRGHPRAVGARLRLRALLRQHVRHRRGLGPHALADLGDAREARRERDVDVAVLVGGEPRRGLHVVLADHRARLHVGVDLVAGAVEEAGVHEDHPIRGGRDAGAEVERRALLLVHDPDLEGARGQAEVLLDGGEQLDGERDLVRPVLLGLDDVDAARARVRVPAAAAQVVQRRGDRDQRVEHAFGHVDPVDGHGVGRHVVPAVAHEQQRAAGQHQRGCRPGRCTPGRRARPARRSSRPSRTTR